MAESSGLLWTVASLTPAVDEIKEEADHPNSTSAGRELPRARLERQRQRLLEQLAHAGQELGAVRSVEDAVVAHERDRHRVARGDAAAIVNHRAFLERADREDRRLRRVDDGREAVDPVHPQVRDGERAARQLGGRDLAVADLADQLARLAGDLAGGLLVGVEDVRPHKLFRRGPGPATVAAGVSPDLPVPEEP